MRQVPSESSFLHVRRQIRTAGAGTEAVKREGSSDAQRPISSSAVLCEQEGQADEGGPVELNIPCRTRLLKAPVLVVQTHHGPLGDSEMSPRTRQPTCSLSIRPISFAQLS